MIITNIIMILVSYLIGCFNTGYYYIRLVYKKDIREIGTNVTGARNVSRLAGKKGFIITFVGDALKGAMVVALCRLLEFTDAATLVCIFMALVGHIYPFQLKFKGGKGLSTALGAYLAFDPLIAVYWGIIFVIMFLFIRKATVACALAMLVLPVILFLTGSSFLNVCFFILHALLVNFACRSNIKEYLEG